eukprot:symbB.v1.2.022967.t2/scaffold2072.1/size90432/5
MMSPLTEEQRLVVLKLVAILEGAEERRPLWLLQQLAELDLPSLTEVATYLANHVPSRVAAGATDVELLYLMDVLELVAMKGSPTGKLLHLCLAPILLLCVGHRGAPAGVPEKLNWSNHLGTSVSRRAAALLGRAVARHHGTWPELGLEVLELLKEALQRRPFWRALQGVALCLMHFGPKAVKELLVVALQHPWSPGRPGDADAAPAVLTLMEALRVAAGEEQWTVMELNEKLAKAFGVHAESELLLLAFGNLAEARTAHFARGKKRRLSSDEAATPSTIAQEVVACAQINRKVALRQRKSKQALQIKAPKRPMRFFASQPLMANLRLWCTPELACVLLLEVGAIAASVVVLTTMGSGEGIKIRTDIGALICGSLILLGMLLLALIEICSRGCSIACEVILVYLQIAIHINAVGLGAMTLLGHATWLLAQLLLTAAACAWVVCCCGATVNLWHWLYYLQVVPKPRLGFRTASFLEIPYKCAFLTWAILVALAVSALMFPKLPDTLGLSEELSIAEHVLLMGMGGVFCSALVSPLLLALSQRGRRFLSYAAGRRRPVCLRILIVALSSIILHLVSALVIPLLAHLVIFTVALFLVWLLVRLTRCARRRAIRPKAKKSAATQRKMRYINVLQRSSLKHQKRGHGGCGSDIPTVLVSTLTFLQRYPVLWLRHADDVNSGDGETTLKQREEAAKRELANLIDIKVGQLKFATAKELKMQFHASKGIVNLSYLSADIIVLIHKDLRLLEADRAIALHHGGSKPQRCHWFGAKRFATTMILTSNRQENNIRFLEYLEKRGGHMEPQLVQVRCQCQRLGAYSGVPPAPPEWRCNNCRADPEGCRVARRAVASYRAGHPKAEATLGAMLQSAIKRGHAEVALLCARVLAPLSSPNFLDAALRSRRVGIVGTVLSHSAEEVPKKALEQVEHHWLNAGRDFQFIRQHLQDARTAFFLNAMDEETSEQLVHLLRKPPLNLPRPALQIVKSFIFSRDLSELMRETLVVLNLTDGMHIRS